jgi:nitrogen fixation-related uncharacterized protein
MGTRRSRERRAPGRSAPLRLLLVSSVALLCVGCNIFSWTHDDGASDDPERLLEDAEDALLNRDWDDALQFAVKGIEKDPGLEFPRLRYVAAQAVLARAGISISSYLNAFTNQTVRAKGSADGRRLVVRDDLLNLTLEELQAIASACPQAVAYLRELVEGLENGTITNADLAGARFDVDVGFAVGSLLTAFVTILDADQDLTNGFERSDDIRIVTEESGGYDIVYTGTQPRDEFISNTLVCPLWSRPPDAVPGFASIMEALEGVYDAYLVAKGADTTTDIGCGPALGDKPLDIDTDIIVGQMLDFVYDGVAELFARYVAHSCGCAGGAQ